MQKFLRLLAKHLNLVLLLSVVFFSIPQQVFPSTISCIPVQNAVAAAAPADNLTLQFSTFLGGSAADHGHSIAITEEGSFYVTGSTRSSNFPTKNAFNSTYGGGGTSDAFVAKFTGDGSLLWSTYLGGNSFDSGFSIAVASDDSCYVMGITRSSNFPTKNAYNSTYSGNDDTFLAKFSASGSLLWSCYLGGSDIDDGHSVAVAVDGSCYVVGETWSNDFPTTKNAYDSTFNGGFLDAFVAKFSPNGTLLWSSYLGGYGNDGGFSLAVTSDGSFFVTGFTDSPDFPTLNAYDPTPNGDWDVFITKFDASGSLLWSTLLGGIEWDEAYGIVAASDGSCYLTGYTGSPDFPTLNAYDNTYDNWGDAFVAKFAANGSLLWSTFLGGNGVDRGYAIAATSDGCCYVTGYTGSLNFPTMKAYDFTINDGYDVFVTKFSSEGVLSWSTYLGGSQTDQGYGIAVTNEKNCYVIGRTHSTDFPTQNAYINTLRGSDGFVTVFSEPLPPTATQSGYLYGFLAFMVIILLVVVILYKKRK